MKENLRHEYLRRRKRIKTKLYKGMNNGLISLVRFSGLFFKKDKTGTQRDGPKN